MKFPSVFFKEEIREGFIVPEMMKRAWSAELEVLEVIKDICKTEGVRWYAFYGTLLGAIRHKGFIPWDDDIDICMLRGDYDRFLLAAQDNLPEGFVLSGIYGSEPRLWDANKEPQARVIADETLFPLPKYMDRFHGYPYMRIGVDIFPLDTYPENIQEQYDRVKLCNDVHFTVINWDYLRGKGELERRISKYVDLLGLEIADEDEDSIRLELRLAADRLIADGAGGDKVYDVLRVIPPENISDYHPIKGLDKLWFGEGQTVQFEDFDMVVPADADAVLRTIYGDSYMVPRKFEAGHDYPFYKKQEKAFTELLRESGVETPVDEFCRNWHKLKGED